MRRSMKLIHRALLWVVTLFVSVIVAACYGMAYTFQLGGRVLDRDSGGPIRGIKVDCFDDRGQLVGAAVTDEQGWWEIGPGTATSEMCESIRFTDEDGEANGGHHGMLEVSTCGFEPGGTVELGK